MADWLGGWSLLWIGAAWVVVILGACIVVTVLLVRLPSDYFDGDRPPRGRHWGRRAAKNAAGVIVLLIGLALLVLPGPGLLGVLAGVLLLDFPGKRAVERWLLRRRHVLAAANWLRRRAGRRPLVIGG
ncbi:MAG: hypothetical protein IT437_01680 [Phycisphaerales bacterium]|nr:hypothetical protein [Phycisphaerales bacterium]